MNELFMMGIITAVISILSFTKTEFIYFIFSFRRFKENKAIEDTYFHLLGKGYLVLTIFYFATGLFYDMIPENIGQFLLFMFVIGKIVFADIPINRELKKHVDDGCEGSIKTYD